MLYPPILASTQPVFAVTELTNGYKVHFTLSSITSESEIGHIGILVAQQSNNKSIANTTNYPDGIIYKTYTAGQSYVIIENSDLGSVWQGGSLYKIQLRFGSSKLVSMRNGTVQYLDNGGTERSSSFSAWHKAQVNANAFSEWSTAMIVKAISGVEITISKEDSVFRPAEASRIQLVSSLTPTFYGQCIFAKTDKEAESSYRFTIYENSTLLETTGWLPHVGGPGGQDSGYFKTRLENRHVYQISYEIQSNNGYYAITGPTDFIAIQSTVGDITNLDIHVVTNITDGCIDVSLVALDNRLITGNYIITRTSSESNYSRFEDMKYLNYVNKDLQNEEIVFTDYTVESGVTYQYALQGFTTQTLRTNAKLSGLVNLNLEYAYLYSDGIQLQLCFNQDISSFKHTTLRSKQDTLGDRYPHLFQNGNAYYAEFPISGLISYQGNTKAFFHQEFNGLYYKDEFVIPTEKFEDRSGNRKGGLNLDYTISTDLTVDNIYIERKFREKVEEFLNNFKCKLYRSATEGNILINLMNINLSPNTELGRMIFSFSATAYEIAEPTIENLEIYGVLDRGSLENLDPSKERLYSSFGQIIYWPGVDTNTIYQKIAEQEEIEVGEIYRYELKWIDGFWIEPYPQEAIQAEIDEQVAKKGSNNVDSYLRAAAQQPSSVQLIMRVNGANILIQPYRVFTLSANDSTISHITSLSNNSNYNRPIIVNYTCTLILRWNSSVQETASIEVSSDIGQVRGLFSTNDDELRHYNSDYRRVDSPEIAIIKNYSIYKTKDIDMVIKYAIKTQIEKEKGVSLISVDDGVWKTSSGNTEYRLTGIQDIDIETNSGTIVNIGESTTVYNTYTVGSSQRFDLTHIYFVDALNHANFIEFANENSVYALINFNYFLEERTALSYS